MTIDVTLANVGSLLDATTAETTLNNNNTAIVTGFETALNTSGDQMQGNLDMNGLQVLNLPAPATANSPLRLQDLDTFNGGGSISQLPAGGTTNQALVKNSNVDYDFKWATEGGSVTSVGLSMPSDFAVTNSPVTNTGTLTANWVNTPTGTGAVVKQTSPTITAPTISQIINTGVLTLPSSTDTLVGRATTDTLTNKTLTSPVISTITNSGTLTLPTATDTLVGRGTSDTLINKTINGSNNSLSNIALSSLANQNSYSLAGNFTSSTGPLTTSKINSLVNKASPVSADMLLIQDSVTGALEYVTVGSVSSAGSVASVGGLTGTIGLGNGLTTSSNNIVTSLNNSSIYLTSDVSLTTANTQFNILTLSPGTGVWLIHAGFVAVDPTATEPYLYNLTDGTTIWTSGGVNAAVGIRVNGTLSAVVTNPSVVKLTVGAWNGTTAVVKANSSGFNKDTYLIAVRIG